MEVEKEIKTEFSEILKKFGKVKSKPKKVSVPESFQEPNDQGSAFGGGDETIEGRLLKLQNESKKYSDVISFDKNEKELQWVHFVQQGGGTLGISLVGFTFVLEYVGIRFLRLAGTSAGAINTLFLAAIGAKDDPKSPELYRLMNDPAKFDMKNFVDASNPIVRWLIFSLGKGKGLIFNLIISFVVLFIMVLIPLPIISRIGWEGSVAYLTLLLVFILVTVVVIILLSRLGKHHFGINPGIKFTEFLENTLKEYGVNNISDLNRKAVGGGDFELSKATDIKEGDSLKAIAKLHPIPEKQGGKDPDTNGISKRDKGNDLNIKPLFTLSLRPGVPYVNNLDVKRNYKHVKYDYSFVSTDFCNGCKVVFPEDANLYFSCNKIQKINPATFVRASMAIPLFFEPQFFPDKPQKGDFGKDIDDRLKVNWEIKGIKADQVAKKGVLIDGGSLSNFPINLFHEPEIKEPRMPIIGALIVDEKPVNRYDPKKSMSLSYYLGSIINTLRNNEDNAFLAANPFYRMYSIAEINAYETKVNWLNFDLTQKEKDQLFIKGMEAALGFLEGFDWVKYKEERVKRRI